MYMLAHGYIIQSELTNNASVLKTLYIYIEFVGLPTKGSTLPS
jgi:hypothetical protein